MPHVEQTPTEPWVWHHPPTRRQVACMAAITELWKLSQGSLYLWTVTFPTIERDEHHAAVMSEFWAEWQRRHGRCSAVRVAELHASGVVHFHIVLNRRYSAGALWRLARKCGVGRIDVLRINTLAGAAYVAKYLGKEKAEIPGVRRFSRSGFSFGRLADQQCDGTEPAIVRAVLEAERSPVTGKIPRNAWQKARRAIAAYRRS